MVDSKYLNEPTNYKGILDILFISSNTNKVIMDAINEGNFNQVVMESSEELTTEDLAELIKMMNKFSKEDEATMVEIREDSKKKV